MDTWWVGPCEVVERVGDLSYRVSVKPGVVQDVHMDQLKPYVEDVLAGERVELYHHMRGYKVLETEPDEWEVEKILGHRRGPRGLWEFLTKWEGTPQGRRRGSRWAPSCKNIATRGCNIPKSMGCSRMWWAPWTVGPSRKSRAQENCQVQASTNSDPIRDVNVAYSRRAAIYTTPTARTTYGRQSINIFHLIPEAIAGSRLPLLATREGGPARVFLRCKTKFSSAFDPLTLCVSLRCYV